MAYYKYSTVLESSPHNAFDELHSPGGTVPFSGIYKCEVCGQEDVSTQGHTFPPQNHHQHPAGQPIRWRLIVATKGS